LFGRRFNLGHVSNGSAEREEIRPEVLVEYEVSIQMLEIPRVSTTHLMTLVKVGEIADELQLGPVAPEENRMRKHFSPQSGLRFRT
jgi:hypothetical protein